MTTARWTAALFVALAVARPGSADPKPIEVTPDRDVVWEFRSPHRVDRRGEVLVAILGGAIRILAEEVDEWLEAPQPDEAAAPAPRSR